MATRRVIEWRAPRLDFDRGLNREFHGSRIEPEGTTSELGPAWRGICFSS